MAVIPQFESGDSSGMAFTQMSALNEEAAFNLFERKRRAAQDEADLNIRKAQEARAEALHPATLERHKAEATSAVAKSVVDEIKAKEEQTEWQFKQTDAGIELKNLERRAARSKAELEVENAKLGIQESVALQNQMVDLRSESYLLSFKIDAAPTYAEKMRIAEDFVNRFASLASNPATSGQYNVAVAPIVDKVSAVREKYLGAARRKGLSVSSIAKSVDQMDAWALDKANVDQHEALYSTDEQYRSIWDKRRDSLEKQELEKAKLDAAAEAERKKLEDKPPPQFIQEKLDKYSLVVKQLNEVKSQIRTQGTTLGPIISRVRRFDPTDKDFKVLEASITGLIPGVARGIFGEVGVLTDQDIANYRKAIADSNNPQAINEAIIENLDRLLRDSISDMFEVNGQYYNLEPYRKKLNSLISSPPPTEDELVSAAQADLAALDK